MIDIKTKEEGPSFKEDVSVKMNTEGSWTSILKLFDMLEKMPFGASIQNISIDSETRGAWTGSMDVIIFREK